MLDVPAEEVGGGRPVPGGVAIGTLEFGTATSLIRVRHEFMIEIVKTAEDL